MRSIEFFDYIFDRYAYLGLSPESTPDEVASEIRRRRAAIHPDKLLRVSPNILAEAQRERALVDECARLLTSPDIRSMYDRKLADFKAKEAHLVSSSGMPLLDPSRFRIDLDYLIGEEASSTEAIEAQARSMSGMDEKRIAKARRRAEASPGDMEARDALRDELTKKLVHLSAMEDIHWQTAGVSGGTAGASHGMAEDGSHFAGMLEAKMAEVRLAAIGAVERRDELASLGFAPRLLLPGTGPSEGPCSLSTAALAARAVESFELRADALKACVAEKSKTIDELASIPRWARLNAHRGTRRLDILMIRSDCDYEEGWPGSSFAQVGFIFRLDKATSSAEPVLATLSPEEIASWPDELVALEANPEIPGHFIEAIALANLLTGEGS